MASRPMQAATEPRSQNSGSKKVPTYRPNFVYILIVLAFILINCQHEPSESQHSSIAASSSRRPMILLASGHIVLTKNDHDQSLVLTGEDGNQGGGGKGGGDQLVITGHNMNGGGGSSNMVMQNAAEREGDVVINGNSMIVPGEDGHIVLADARSNQPQGQSGPAPNLWAFWAPFIRGRSAYNFPYASFGLLGAGGGLYSG